jgi:prefoldin alpha subunit
MSSSPQQVNVSDLDVAQLSDVRRQLEEVRPEFINAYVAHFRAGAKSPHELVRPIKAS